MAETGTLSQQIQEQASIAGRADILIGLPALRAAEDIPWIESLASALNKRLAIVFPGPAENSHALELAGALLIPYPAPAAERYSAGSLPIDGGFQEVCQIAKQLEAKCCCLWNGDPRQLSEATIRALVTPAIEEAFDLTLAHYVETPFGSLINNGILSPAVRALYGRRVRYPMAPDCVLSSRLLDRLFQFDPRTKRLRAQLWTTSEVICGGLTLCQVHVPTEPPRPAESTDTSALLALVVGRLFQDLERNVGYWQRSGGSSGIATFGEASAGGGEEESPVDVQPMLETFHLGYRNLKEIWSVAMPPATFLELKKLAALKADAFSLPDDLWVRIIYDFALAHRQRSMNREHLLRAMTPLYLAWVASHVRELRTDPGAFRAKLERLALCYEKHKPYLVSRWRWPDRFNP